MSIPANQARIPALGKISGNKKVTVRADSLPTGRTGRCKQRLGDSHREEKLCRGRNATRGDGQARPSPAVPVALIVQNPERFQRKRAEFIKRSEKSAL